MSKITGCSSDHSFYQTYISKRLGGLFDMARDRLAIVVSIWGGGLSLSGHITIREKTIELFTYPVSDHVSYMFTFCGVVRLPRPCSTIHKPANKNNTISTIFY